ncbi:MAG: segregation/condensation protein A [Verrucomicrobiota bacterium]
MTVLSPRTRLRFSELFAEASNRSEVICTFLALLELIRMKQLVCAQADPFAEIEIGRAAPRPTPPTPEDVPTESATEPPIENPESASHGA